ncbi:MAG TPA: FtsX-like permease family protein [Solirubrobacteraceae bacterium]|nr:FtsX-like permease family protein [Solirubrobacteraceae bacterium]
MIALVLRGMAQRRLRSALTALAILLGVAMIAGTYVQTDQIRTAFEDIQQTANEGTDAVVRPKKEFGEVWAAGRPVPESLVGTVARVPGVARAAGELWDSGALVVRGKRIASDFAPSSVMATLGAPFDPTKPIAGRQPSGPGEVGVISQTAEKEDLQVGQPVGLATRTGVKQVTIVGIFEFGDVASVGGASIITATLPQVQEWFEREGEVMSIRAAAEDGVSPEALAARISEVTTPDLEVKTGAADAQQSADDINDSIGGFLTPMLLALSGAAVLVGAFIIFNTFSITVAQRTREFALLRALGSTRRQIVGAVAGEALIVGVVASGLGLLAGLGFAKLLGGLFDAAGFGIPRSGMELAPRTIAVALVVGIGVTLLAALVPALRATRVTPVQALTGASVPSRRRRRLAPVLAAVVSVLGLGMLLTGLFGGGAATARMGSMAGGAVLMFVGMALMARHIVRPVAALAGWPLERAFHTPGRLARENAMRNPGRTATTSSALMVGLGLVVFVAVFAAGMKATVSDSFDRLLTSDLVVTSQSMEPLPNDAGDALANVPGLRAVTPQFVDQIEVNGEPSDAVVDVLNGVQPRELRSVWAFEWRKDGTDALLDRLTGTSAIVEEQFAKQHGIRIGEDFIVQTPTGARVHLQAIGEYRDPMMLSGIVVEERTFARASAIPDPFAYFIKNSDRTDPAVVRADIEDALSQFPAAKVQTTDEYRDEIGARLDQMVYLLYALLAMSVVISLFGIANSLFLSIHERTREFGLLRAIGATRAQVRRVVRYESVITAIIGGLLGIAIGLLFGYLMTAALADLGLSFSVPVGQLAGFLVLAVVVGVLAAVVPARRGARIDVLEALHQE